LKNTRSSLTRKLDKVVSNIVRSRGECVKCRNKDYSKLQCCHIFSRANRSVRWDFKNVLCLCSGCHFWSHQNPLLFTEFVREWLGEYEYTQLKLRAKTPRKFSVAEMEELLGRFVQITEESI